MRLRDSGSGLRVYNEAGGLYSKSLCGGNARLLCFSLCFGASWELGRLVGVKRIERLG